jgi:hypothetical protein
MLIHGENTLMVSGCERAQLEGEGGENNVLRSV